MPYAEPLPDDEIAQRLKQLPGWQREGGTISKTFPMRRYLDGLAFVTHVVAVEEAMDHHADILYLYREVMVSITTHVTGNTLTHKDFELAERIEGVAGAHGVK